jgi:hypothetical protein
MQSLVSVTSFQKQVHYLGHVITKEGVEVDPDKIKSIMDWPTPKYVVDIISFMGLVDTIEGS